MYVQLEEKIFKRSKKKGVRGEKLSLRRRKGPPQEDNGPKQT